MLSVELSNLQPTKTEEKGYVIDYYFCNVDDFCKSFEKIEERKMIEVKGRKQFVRKSSMELSDMMTIMIYFHHSGYKNFKHYYERLVQDELRTAFRNLVSYNQFIGMMTQMILPLYTFTLMHMQGKNTGLSFIDSFSLPVCHNKRIYSHKVFKGLAQRGKTSMGWFYGFKLHLITNHVGEIVSFAITKGNISDGNMTKNLAQNLEGFLFGDKGYLSNKTTSDLLKQGLHLITKVRTNMKPKPISKTTKFLLYRRGIIETIFGQLKEFQHLVHTKYRSITGYFTNILSALIAYTLNPTKPRVALNRVGVA